jgi:transcriptional regulator with XRE-family HTH domain
MDTHADQSAPPGARISRERLDLELLRRGWSAADLATAARVSATTISGARNGRRISPRTLRQIAVALTAAPTVVGVDALLGVTDVQP